MKTSSKTYVVGFGVLLVGVVQEVDVLIASAFIIATISGLTGEIEKIRLEDIKEKTTGEDTQ